MLFGLAQMLKLAARRHLAFRSRLKERDFIAQNKAPDGTADVQECGDATFGIALPLLCLAFIGFAARRQLPLVIASNLSFVYASTRGTTLRERHGQRP